MADKAKAEQAPPIVNVTMPKITITPEITMPDVIVNTGETRVHAQFDMPQKPMTRTVTAERGPDGKLVGVITEVPDAV